MKIKNILISQPEPQIGKSPYSDLVDKYALNIDFRPFIHVEGVTSKEFRRQQIEILNHTAFVFNSKTGIDNFFRICEELRVVVPETMKYFCVSETIANYLQKYIQYRKRKIFFTTGNSFKGLIDIMAKHADDKFLLVLSDVHQSEIFTLMDKGKYKYSKGIFYKTVSSNLSDVEIETYDILAFFSPQGIKSLFINFPDFQQKDIAIAAFGPSTEKAVLDSGLRLDIKVPTKEALSMPSALELYVKNMQKPKKK